MKTFGERLRQIRKERGFKSQTALAKAFCDKTTHASVSDWENDKYQPGRDASKKLISILNVNWNYLDTGKEPKYRDEINDIDFINENAYKYTHPIIEWNELDKDVVMSDLVARKEFLSNHGDNDSFALIVNNESMQPEFRLNEQVLVDKNKNAKNGDFCIIKFSNGKCAIRQFISDGTGEYAKAANPDWPKPIIELNNDDFIIGVIIEARRTYT